MSEVIFLDTSIMCALLDIPGKNAEHAVIANRFREIVLGEVTLILPIASVVETGNHIANISDGGVRRNRAERLELLLADSADAVSPWVVNNVRWDADHVRAVVQGRARPFVMGWKDAATQRIGMGDLSICHEMISYAAGTAVPSSKPIKLWTIDAALATLATSLGFPVAA